MKQHTGIGFETVMKSYALSLKKKKKICPELKA